MFPLIKPRPPGKDFQAQEMLSCVHSPKIKWFRPLPAVLVLTWGDRKGRGLTLKVADELQERVQSFLTLNIQTTLVQGPGWTPSGSCHCMSIEADKLLVNPWTSPKMKLLVIPKVLGTQRQGRVWVLLSPWLT